MKELIIPSKLIRSQVAVPVMKTCFPDISWVKEDSKRSLM